MSAWAAVRRAGLLAVGAHIVVEHVVGYAEEPCGKPRESAESRDVGVGLDKRVLREVVAQLFVAQRLVQEEPSDGRLILAHKRVESAPVVQHSHPRDEREVVEFFHCRSFLVCSAFREGRRYSVSSF